jgi:hypothetical protein
MIAVERGGRLGNQLFQFAFGIAAAARLGTSFVMQDDDLRRVFTLGPYGSPLPRALRALRFRAGQRIRPYRVVKIYDDSFDDPAQALDHLVDRSLYSGLFHSERFFAGARDQVLAAFTFRPEHERRFWARYADLLETPYVCCHVRRTDFLLLGEGGVALPASYYLDCLEELDPGEAVPIVFVGDDFVGLREELDRIPGARFERNDEALDLLLLVHAASIVTANSTFSWWGAYLNRAPGTRVLVPWMGSRGRTARRQHLIPDGWQHVAVRTVGCAPG